MVGEAASISDMQWRTKQMLKPDHAPPWRDRSCARNRGNALTEIPRVSHTPIAFVFGMMRLSAWCVAVVVTPHFSPGGLQPAISI